VGDNRYFKFKIEDSSKSYKAQKQNYIYQLPSLTGIENVGINSQLQTRLFGVTTSKNEQNQIYLKIKNITKFPLPVKYTDKIELADLDGFRYAEDLKNITDLPADGFWLDPGDSYTQYFKLSDSTKEKCNNNPCRAYFKFKSQIADLDLGEFAVNF